MKVYTSADGLARNQVYHIFEDSRRFIWLCTGEGISRFDGYEFTNYGTDEGLPDRAVSEMIETSAGGYWAATRSGLCRFDWSSTRARATRRITVFVPEGGKGAGSVNVIREDPSGAIKIARRGFITYDRRDGLASSGIGSLFETRAGELCAIVRVGDIIINRFDGRVFHAIRPRLPGGITDLGWGWYQAVLQDHTGEWWIPTGQGLCRYPSTDSPDDLARMAPSAVYTTRDGLSGDDVFRLYEDSHGDLWIGTITIGRKTLTRWERTTGEFHQFSGGSRRRRRRPSARTAAVTSGLGSIRAGLRGIGRGRSSSIAMSMVHRSVSSVVSTSTRRGASGSGPRETASF